MLELIEISKVYRGGKLAVDGVTMELEPGVIGLLGPNGAGKSSLMRIAATVTRPTTGRVVFDGTDVVAEPDVLRRVLGYLPQDFGVYPNLTSREFLSYLAAAKGVPARAARARVDELIELVNLTDAVKRPLARYSGGMLRRVGIAQTLLTDPRVLIVDEPTAGLDPEERMRFGNLLGDLAADRVVLLSTHIVSDIEAVAGDIVVVANGRLCGRGTPEELLGRVNGLVWEVTVPSEQVAAVQARYAVGRTMRTPQGVQVRLLSQSQPYSDAAQVTPNLEDAYLALVRESTGGLPQEPGVVAP